MTRVNPGERSSAWRTTAGRAVSERPWSRSARNRTWLIPDRASRSASPVEPEPVASVDSIASSSRIVVGGVKGMALRTAHRLFSSGWVISSVVVPQSYEGKRAPGTTSTRPRPVFASSQSVASCQ